MSEYEVGHMDGYESGKDRIAELEAEVDRLNDVMGHNHGVTAALARRTAGAEAAARIAELEAGLAPFAEAAELADDQPDGMPVNVLDDLSLTVADLRRARAVLSASARFAP